LPSAGYYDYLTRGDMKIGIIISVNDAETCWNALRYANFCLGVKDEAKVFFMGKGVEYQKISTDKFNPLHGKSPDFSPGMMRAFPLRGPDLSSMVRKSGNFSAQSAEVHGPPDFSPGGSSTIEQADKFLESGGKIYACGTCIKSREQEGFQMCPISTMKDMYDIVKESDKVVTF